MNSINYAVTGLASSLLLNLGLSRLAERLDPMLQQSSKALRRMLDPKSSAFTELPCQFKASAFTELPCQFKASAFTELPCQFTPQAAK